MKLINANLDNKMRVYVYIKLNNLKYKRYHYQINLNDNACMFID